MEFGNISSGHVSGKTRMSVGLALLLALVAFSLRAWHGFQWPLDGDEIYTLANARAISWPVDPAVLTKPIYAACPLSFLLQKPCLAYFDDHRVALRLVPFLAGVLACPLLLLFSWRSCGAMVAVVASLFLVASAYHVEMSQYARFYSLVFLFANLALASFQLALERQSYGWLFAAHVALLAAVASHLPALFLLPVELVYLGIWQWGQVRSAGSPRKPAAFWWIATTITLAILLAFGSTIWNAARQWGPVVQAGGRSPTGLILGWTGAVGVGVAVLNLWAIVYLCWSRDRRASLWIVAQVIPAGALLALSLAGKTVVPSYVGYIYWPVYMTCALFVERLFRAISSTTRRLVIVGGMVVIALASTLPSLLSQYVDGNRHDFPAAITQMQNGLAHGGTVYSSWPHVFAYHAERMLDIPVVMSGAGEKLGQNQLVVCPLAQLVQMVHRADLVNARRSAWVIVKVQRDGTIAEDRSGRLAAFLDTQTEKRFERSRRRFDYRRNRLDGYVIRP